MRIAVLGTGIMGAPMARNLAAAGHEVRAWNRTREKAEGLGAEVVDSPAEAVAGAELVITMLADGAAVGQVMEEALPALSDGAVWAQTSTVGIADTARFAASRRLFLDSPVLGSRDAAEAGKLLLLASGNPEARDRAAPALAAVSTETLWLGDEAGLGTSLKLVVNLWIMNLVENVAETLALAEGLGLDPQHVLDAIRGRPMDSPYAHLKGEKILRRDFSPAFALKHGHKDVRLALEAAVRAGVDLGLARATEERFRRAIELGHGDEDGAAVWFASAPE